jgi:8-oxo-dGTP diphosphatase
MNTRYVAGFLFDPLFESVSLIRKNRPKWQAGLLNGIGGHIDGDETALAAMFREFKEETGYHETMWTLFARLKGPEFSVEFFAAIGNPNLCKTVSDEPVEVICVHNLHIHQQRMVENVPWLIHLAIDVMRDGRPQFVEACYP